MKEPPTPMTEEGGARRRSNPLDLRGLQLAGDGYGEAVRRFSIHDIQLHRR
jgi:hypothetical protein